MFSIALLDLTLGMHGEMIPRQSLENLHDRMQPKSAGRRQWFNPYLRCRNGDFLCSRLKNAAERTELTELLVRSESKPTNVITFPLQPPYYMSSSLSLTEEIIPPTFHLLTVLEVDSARQKSRRSTLLVSLASGGNILDHIILL
jgi:hypothetical protein